MPNEKKKMHLKHPEHWEVAVSVSDCAILSSAVFSEARSFLLRCGITGWHEGINNHPPCKMTECKELTLLLSRVPAASVLKEWVRREGILVDYIVAHGFRAGDGQSCSQLNSRVRESSWGSPTLCLESSYPYKERWI